MRRISILLVVLVMVVILLLGRERSSIYRDESETKALIHQTGQNLVEIQTFDTAKQPRSIYLTEIPSRVFVSEGSILESLLALGQGDRIVSASISGASSGAYERIRQEYPEELEKVPHIAPQGMNREQAVAYAPDFIMGWQSAFTLSRFGTVSWWQDRGVNTYIAATSNHVLKYGTIEDECKF